MKNVPIITYFDTIVCQGSGGKEIPHWNVIYGLVS